MLPVSRFFEIRGFFSVLPHSLEQVIRLLLPFHVLFSILCQKNDDMKLERFYASSMYAQRLRLFFVFVSFALVDTCDVNVVSCI